jgi:hypothetical protein
VYRRLPGLSIRATQFLIALAEQEFSDWNAATGRPKSLSVIEALQLCLRWLRRNLTLPEAGEDFGIGTTTAWEYAHLMAAFLADVLGCPAEELAEQVSEKVILFDGTLVPTFNWRHRRDLHSGKHKRYGANVQAVADIHAPRHWREPSLPRQPARQALLRRGRRRAGGPSQRRRSRRRRLPRNRTGDTHQEEARPGAN